MHEEKPSVPSFGAWDAETEIPYTTVFEKVRASKDGKPLRSSVQLSCRAPTKYHFQGNPSLIYRQYDTDEHIDTSSDHQYGKRLMLNDLDVYAKRETSVQSSSSRRSSLEQIADHIFMESQHAAGNESPVVSRKPTTLSCGYANSSELREPYVKENVYLQPLPGNLSNCPYHGSSSDGHNQGHQAYGGRVPGHIISPRKEHGLPKDSVGSHLLYCTPGIQKYHQPFLTKNQNSEMPPDRVLPKFGDWDALDPTKVEFTVIFDKARNERKSTLNQEYSSSTKVVPDASEDLYKSSTTRNGFGSWICCGVPSAS